MRKLVIVIFFVISLWDVNRFLIHVRRVLYFSIHRYENGTFWPNLRESNVDFIGEGAGKGYNFNIPLNKTGLGNAEYLTIFHQLLLPIAIEVIFIFNSVFQIFACNECSLTLLQNFTQVLCVITIKNICFSISRN